MEMIELKSHQQLHRAIERARREAKNLVVRSTCASRQYTVLNRVTGNRYQVDFFVRKGSRFGHCSCKAGQNGLACKHVAAAAGLNLYLAAQGLLGGKRVSLT